MNKKSPSPFSDQHLQDNDQALELLRQRHEKREEMWDHRKLTRTAIGGKDIEALFHVAGLAVKGELSLSHNKEAKPKAIFALRLYNTVLTAPVNDDPNATDHKLRAASNIVAIADSGLIKKGSGGPLVSQIIDTARRHVALTGLYDGPM